VKLRPLEFAITAATTQAFLYFSRIYLLYKIPVINRTTADYTTIFIGGLLFAWLYNELVKKNWKLL